MTDWQDISTAPRDGTLCELRFRDALGVYENHEPHFLHEDGKWYNAERALMVGPEPKQWRPIACKERVDPVLWASSRECLLDALGHQIYKNQGEPFECPWEDLYDDFNAVNMFIGEAQQWAEYVFGVPIPTTPPKETP